MQSGAIGALRAFVTARWAEITCALILLLMAVALVRSLPHHTITTDETVHIPAGYANWNRHDFAPNNEHPPLAKLWATLPWLVLDPPEPPLTQATTPAKRTIDTGRYFWQLNADRMADLLFWARVPMIGLTLLLGALIFGCGRRLFGPRAGLLAVALFSLEPTVLAHGPIVHTDIPASVAYLGWWAALAHYAARPSWRRATIVGLVSGAALATKYNLLVLLPLGALALAILWLLAPRRGGARTPIVAHGAIIALLILLVVNAVYFFGRQPLTATDIAWLRDDDPARAAWVLPLMRALTPLVPPYYQLGAYTVLTHNADGHPAGLLGEFSTQGWWYYFPVAFAMKTTLPFLLLALAALGWAGRRLITRREIATLVPLIPFAFYTVSAMNGSINIGIRHLLPAFPFLFILGGATLDRLLRLRCRRALGMAVVVLTLGWMGVEAARAYPHYIPYLNQLARSQPHWHYLSDSNVEWGDDVGALARYLQARGETSVRGALSGGWGTLPLYGIEYLDMAALPPQPLRETRYIAVGASFLNGSTVPGATAGGDAAFQQGRRDLFAAYRGRAPEAVFGHSIYLYRADDAAPAGR